MTPGWRTTVSVLACLATASSALAQPATTNAKNRQAGALVSKAFDKSEAGEHEAAIALFTDAYKILPNPVLLSHIGTELMKSGKLRDALQWFCQYLETDPNGPNAQYASSTARRLQIQLGNKSGEACAKPRPEPPLPPPPAAEPVTVPVSSVVLPPTTVEPSDRGSSTLRYAGLAVGGVGILALGIGGWQGIEAQRITNQINERDGENEPWQADIRDLQARGQDYENRQIVLLISGGLLVAGGAVMYLLGRPSAEQPRDKPVVGVTPTTNGVAISGRF